MNIDWNGEGIPPVGLEVEARVAVGYYVGAAKSEWATCQLVCSSRAYVVLRCIGSGYSEDHEVSHELALVEFRPIRTAEQIAAEERAHQIELMSDIFRDVGSVGIQSGVAALYDAGYRKP